MVQDMLDCTYIYTWCKENLLTVNCKKCQWMRTNLIEKTLKNDQFRTVSTGTIK